MLLLTGRASGSCKTELLHYRRLTLLCLKVIVRCKYIADILEDVIVSHIVRCAEVIDEVCETLR